MEKQMVQSIVGFSEQLSERKNSYTDAETKKALGQYFTSAEIANFMAELSFMSKKNLKVLDPGGGMGILIGALVDRIINEHLGINLTVDVYEVDINCISLLRECMEKCKEVMERQGNEFVYNIIQEDFIIHNSYLFEDSVFIEHKAESPILYDLVISNPPYYKVSKKHRYSEILKNYIHGQPNVYFMFMVIAEKLLQVDGQLVFITPRSYCSGAYFEKFRSEFFFYIDPDQIHLFTSRKGNFKGEKVLQENVILSGYKRKTKKPFMTISASMTYEIKETYTQEVFEKALIFDSSDQQYLLRLPTSQEEANILELFDKWSNNLSLMEIEISTGPVITFRHNEFIKEYDPETTYPLLYMKNLKNMEVAFPLGIKDEGVTHAAEKKTLLLPSNNYVLLKRFTSKEQKKRVDCSIFIGSRHNYEKVGLENHLNYIYKPRGNMSLQETYGIAGFLNSELVDRYFRIVNGNTQVNASDIRPLPFPEHSFITELGQGILDGNIEFKDIDQLLGQKFLCGEELEKVSYIGKLEEAINILEEVGMPKRQQNKRSGLTLLSLLNLKEENSWHEASQPCLRVVDIMAFMSNNYGQTYAPNSRETIRRQTIHQFEQANIVERNADDSTRATNSGNTVYSITDEFLKMVKSFENSDLWSNELSLFKEQNSTLIEKYSKKRDIHKVPVQIDAEILLSLSSGKHNILQRQVIEEFGAIFARGAKVLYLGDTANKSLFVKEDDLISLNIPPLSHDKLPDVVLYDEEKNWIYLIEAVTTHGPISPKRQYELEKMLERCPAGKIYVTAFPDMKLFKKYADDIAWETEVWLADMPEHMLHLNGDRFFGPR